MSWSRLVPVLLTEYRSTVQYRCQFPEQTQNSDLAVGAVVPCAIADKQNVRVPMTDPSNRKERAGSCVRMMLELSALLSSPDSQQLIPDVQHC